MAVVGRRARFDGACTQPEMDGTQQMNISECHLVCC